MKRNFISIGLLLATAAFFTITPQTVAADEKGDAFKLVHKVTEAKVRVTEGSPKQIHLKAEGETKTGGWTDVKLRPTDSKPSDGIYDFRFVGRHPVGMATQVITPVKAELTMQKPDGFKGARVIAESNSMEAH